jgi:hypothetical protein
MGWPPAQQASATEWMPPFLAHLFDDPYSVVRHIAHRSLRTQLGFEDFAFDYVASAETRQHSRTRAMVQWQGRSRRESDHRAHVLLNPDGTLQRDTFNQFAAQRDDRLLDLRE